MALNTIAYAEILQTALDKKAVADLTSGFMDANAGQVIYDGGNSIKIPKMSMTGLMEYDRDNGYVTGSVTLEYEKKTKNHKKRNHHHNASHHIKDKI